MAAMIPAVRSARWIRRAPFPAIDHLPPLHGRLILRYAIDYICGSDGTAEAGRLVSRGRKRIGMRVSIVRDEETLRPGLSSTRRPG